MRDSSNRPIKPVSKAELVRQKLRELDGEGEGPASSESDSAESDIEEESKEEHEEQDDFLFNSGLVVQ